MRYLHGGIWEVGGFTEIRLGKGVEEGRFTDVGQTNDTNLPSEHILSIAASLLKPPLSITQDGQKPTFKLFPGRPRTIFFSASCFFLGGIFFDLKVIGVLVKVRAGKLDRVGKSRVERLSSVGAKRVARCLRDDKGEMGLGIQRPFWFVMERRVGEAGRILAIILWVARLMDGRATGLRFEK